MPSKKEKNCPEGDIGTYRREGGKKDPLFLLHQKGDISLWREGSKYFCHMSHNDFCFSVSTQFHHHLHHHLEHHLHNHICRNISRVSGKINSYELGHTSNTWQDLFYNIYFLQNVCVEITKRVIDNKDNLINNNDLIAPGANFFWVLSYSLGP